MRILSLAGSPRDIGEAFGEISRPEIHELYRRRVDNAIAQALKYGGQRVDEGQLLAVAQASIDVTRDYHPAGMDELEGIAAGAEMLLVKVLAMNGLTDFRDVLSWPGNAAAGSDTPAVSPSDAVARRPADLGGCTAIVVQKDRAGAVLCGQTWDLATDNLPFVIGMVRAPMDGPVTRTLTTDGCLSLIGMNDRGIAVGTTNIRTKDARAGVNYLSIIHKALAAESFEAAVEAVVTAPRAGAHFYYVADSEQVALLECSAMVAQRHDLARGVAVHANHCLLPENQAIEGSPATSSSRFRQARMEALAGAVKRLGPEVVQGFFADVEGGSDAICRDDIDGLNTNGAVVMVPEQGLIRIVHGVPSRGLWVDLAQVSVARR